MAVCPMLSLGVRIPLTTAQWLSDRAQARQCTVSMLVRRMIEAELRRDVVQQDADGAPPE
jgi:hypothetical protein